MCDNCWGFRVYSFLAYRIYLFFLHVSLFSLDIFYKFENP
jgi:hypothetical protein